MSARKSLAATLAAVVAGSALALTAGPASAAYTSDPDDTAFTPVAADLIGFGSDTTQHALKLVADAWNADTSHTFKISSYAATGGGTITLPNGSEITRPNGSGAGKKALYQSQAVQGDADFARSSSKLSTEEIENGLKAIPFAADTVVMAVSNSTASNAPANISVADLVKIYKCETDFRNWSAFGGSAGTIVPQVPQSSSGTAGTFKAALDAANGGTLTYGTCVVDTVQEHDDSTVMNNANAIVPISKGRAQLLNGTVRIETGFSNARALYNVVRSSDLAKPEIQAVFGENGFVCSAAANELIADAGFQQLATPAHSGACGTAVSETSNFTLNQTVTTATAVSATSPAANSAKVVAKVTGATAPTGSVTFYEGATKLAENVPLVSGQATLSKSGVAAGAHTYRAVFTPNDAVFLGSEGTAKVTVAAPVVKTKAAISESFPAKVKLKKAKSATVKGIVTVKGATGKVTVKQGKKTLKSASLKGGKASIKLAKLKKGTYKLTIAYAGDAKHLAGTKTFTIKVVK
jgi:hypothetical protein